MPITPINGLPSPDDNSPNDPPIHFDALNALLDSRLVPRFTSAADRDSKITAPVEGQVCHVAAQVSPTLPARLMVYSGGGWRLVGPSPLSTLVAPWTEPPGVFGVNPTTLTQYDVADPGFPYRISASVMCEVGAVAAGTRWDLVVRIANSVANGTLDYTVAQQETVDFQRVDTPISNAVYTGSLRVIVEAVRAYGASNGQITGLNKRLNIYRHAA